MIKKVWKNRIKPVLLFLLLTVIFGTVLSACKKESLGDPQEDTGWKIYYVNSEATAVVAKSYVPKTQEKEALVYELIDELKKDLEDGSCRKAIPDTVTLHEIDFDEENQLTLYFEPNYSNLKGIEEVLSRAAVVKTLCQVEGIKYIEYYVSKQPLMDVNSQPIGLMASSDFIDNTGGEVNYRQTVDIILYFTGKSGKSLLQSRHKVEFDGTIPLEQLVIEQLIAGPLEEERGKYPTIPETTKLIKITKKDGICYVDFDSAFLEKLPDVTDEVAIYSVVNSLAELSGIHKVQFSINGETKKMYRESLPFDSFFERNLDLVESTK